MVNGFLKSGLEFLSIYSRRHGKEILSYTFDCDFLIKMYEEDGGFDWEDAL